MQINPELGNSNSVLSPQYYQYTVLSISSNVFARTFNEGRQTNSDPNSRRFIATFAFYAKILIARQALQRSEEK